MLRTALAVPVLIIMFLATFAHASGYSYDYDNYDYDYDYHSYDNSIRHSFNNYNSNNSYYDSNRGYDDYSYTYGYPYSNYSYTYPSYSYDSYNNYGYRNDYHRKPTCSISSYRSSGSNPYDGRVTVTWWSSNATSAYLTGVGSVSTSGSHTFQGSYYSDYTLSVSGTGGSTSCSASNPHYDSGSNYDRGHRYSYVSNPVFTTPVYTYPYIAGTVYQSDYVKLSQTPYTGFDFGPVGNAMYWLGMIVAASLAAYALLYGTGYASPRALAKEVALAARNQIRSVRSLVK
jgi:hypothetical protein